VDHLTNLGYEVRCQKDKVLIVCEASGIIKGEGFKLNKLYYIDIRNIKPILNNNTEIAYVTSTTPKSNLLTWHQRTHLSNALLIKLNKLNLVNGLNLNMYENHNNYSLCECCIAAKQHRRSFRKNKHRNIPSRIFEQIDTDIKGPLKEQPSLFGELWIISFICVKSRYKIIYTLKSKDQAHEALDKFIDEVLTPIKNQLKLQYSIDINISRIHSDMGKEYLGKFKTKCQFYGIKHTTTAPYTPEENSIAENYWKTLMETARAMLFQAQLPLNLWSYAVKYANFVLNRTLIVGNTVNNIQTLKTPYEWIFQIKPDLSNLRTWGCEAHALIDQQHRRTLDRNSSVSYFMGYSQDSTQSSIILYNKNISYNRGIFVSGHVIFNEIVGPRININTGTLIQVGHRILDDNLVENIHDSNRVQNLTLAQVNNDIAIENNINEIVDNDNNDDRNTLVTMNDNNNENNRTSRLRHKQLRINNNKIILENKINRLMKQLDVNNGR
jgi:hypothetical protein